ncbi:MAG: hypothetical protein H8E19_06305 [Deltaproteobacteria bacterium]|uniref:Uncharacterized protein n=1 Tax=Candidatus Desulfacyla euxinica TaxID=2841693 RepID=A0A8J6MZL6_9DELT|nr:hypothetical protein [Candidatus Desulfacyla euxinica]
MPITDKKEWKSRLITPDKALSKIKPGMSIFLGTGVAEPRTLIKSLMASDAGNEPLPSLTLPIPMIGQTWLALPKKKISYSQIRSTFQNQATSTWRNWPANIYLKRVQQFVSAP